jgi:hypothetical protein
MGRLGAASHGRGFPSVGDFQFLQKIEWKFDYLLQSNFFSRSEGGNRESEGSGAAIVWGDRKNAWQAKEELHDSSKRQGVGEEERGGCRV